MDTSFGFRRFEFNKPKEQSNFNSLIRTNSTQSPSFSVVDYTVQKADCGGLLVARRLANGHIDIRICYERDFMYYCAKSPYAILPPPNIRQIVLEMGEIIATFPHRFRPSKNVTYNSKLNNLASSEQNMI